MTTTTQQELRAHFEDVDWNSIPEVRDFIVEWANHQFPKRTAHSAMSKLVLEEVPEMLMAERDGTENLEEEFADTLILLFDWAHMKGIDIAEGLRRKMYRNAFNRTWGKASPNGTWRHETEEI